MNTLNIIHDNRRIERFVNLHRELALQGVSDYKIWEAVVIPDKPVFWAINASHKMIVRTAKEQNLPYVIIAEDDIEFTASDGYEYFLRQMPAEFDIYLACSYMKDGEKYKVCGFHLYVVAAKFYDKFLSVLENEHIDIAMNDIEGADIRFCTPFPALQKAGFSGNNGAFADYNGILSPDEIYNHPL